MGKQKCNRRDRRTWEVLGCRKRVWQRVPNHGVAPMHPPGTRNSDSGTLWGSPGFNAADPPRGGGKARRQTGRVLQQRLVSPQTEPEGNVQRQKKKGRKAEERYTKCAETNTEDASPSNPDQPRHLQSSSGSLAPPQVVLLLTKRNFSLLRLTPGLNRDTKCYWDKRGHRNLNLHVK